MDASLFDFNLPQELIAQRPVEPRDSSRLLVCRGARGEARLGEWPSDFVIEDRTFRDIADMLGPNDFLVMNDARVLPVRLLGKRHEGQGAVEALLLKKLGENEWSCLLHMSAKVKPGLKLLFEPGVVAEILSTHEERLASEGEVRLRFGGLSLAGPAGRVKPLEPWLEKHGHIPLPHYIERQDTERDKQTYQTVYARSSGSAAAPTAGFHFTDELLKKLDSRGVERASVTLHIGIGTFRPLKGDRLEDHVMHEETFEISEAFVARFREARRVGKRIVAIGTTSVRALESWARECESRGLKPGDEGSAGVFDTRLFLRPDEGAHGDGAGGGGAPHGDADRFTAPVFRVVDDLVTNFHLPRSTLIVMIAAAMGLDGMKKAYAHAIEHRYRFFSYGDAMFIRGRNA